MTATRLKHLAEINRTQLAENTDPVFAFRYVDIGAASSTGSVTLPDEPVAFADAPSRARRVAPVGAVLVSTVRTYLRAIARVPPTEEPLVFSTGFAVLEAKPGVDARYLYYLCRSGIIVDEVVARSTGVSYPAIDASDLGDIPVTIPELEEQRRIAGFLDDQVPRLDRATELRDQQSSALAARRLEEVRLATTQGRAGQELRGTGVAWMPTINTAWDLRRLASVFTTGSGTTPPAGNSRYFDGDTPWVNTGDLRDGVIDRVNRTVTRQALTDYPALRLYNPGTLLVAMYGATIGRLGILGMRACTNQACCALTGETSILTDFAYYWFLAHRDGIIKMAAGAGQPNISQEIIRSLRIPAPSRKEQKEIVRDLRRTEAASTSAIELMERDAQLLRERKQALITAALTEQFDITTARAIA